MKKLAYSLTISLSLLISGCSLHQSMPRTIIGLNPKTRAVQIESPKDVEITGFSLVFTDERRSQPRLQQLRWGKSPRTQRWLTRSLSITRRCKMRHSKLGSVF